VKRSEPTSIDDRLRLALDCELTEISEGVDMSSAAITARLKELGELSRLCLELVAVGDRRD
jgi:hypothetical protein